MAEARGGNEHKQLSCPICLESFQSPKVPTCLHTFCEKCICKHAHGLREQWTQSDTINCPVCRSPTPAPATNQTPNDWAAELPTNSVILSNCKSDQSSQIDPVFCQPCLFEGEQQISNAFCVTCQVYLCKTCYMCHKKFKATKYHTITVQSTPDNDSMNVTKDTLFRCSRHMKKYTYVCLQDKELCFSKCATTDHKICKDLLLIENLAKDAGNSPQPTEVFKNLDVLRNMFLTLLANRSKNLEFIQQQKTDLTEAIKKWTMEIKETVHKPEVETLGELEQVYKEETVTLSDEIVDCRSAIAAIEASERMLLQETKSNDNAKLFMTTFKVSHQVRKYVQKHDAAQSSFRNVEIDFESNEVFEENIQTLSSLAEVTIKGSAIPVLSLDVSYEKAMMLLPRAQENSLVTFSANVPDDGKTCNIYSGIFLPDDRFVVSDEKNRKLKLFDRCYHCVLYLKMNYEPRHICSVDNETFAVTTSKPSIDIVRVINTLTKLRSVDVDSECYGIACYEKKIIVHTHDDGLDTLLI